MISSLRYTRQGAIELYETELSQPGPGEVQLRGLVCGVCSWDIATCKLGSSMAKPAPPGHEGVGIVEAVGPDVTGIRPGETYAVGGFQTYSNQPANKLHGRRIPSTSQLPPEQWIVEPVSCCVTGIDTARLQAGDRVALIGCGFMGQILLQMLTRLALADLVALDLSPSRLALASEAGVPETINIQTSGPDLAGELSPRKFDVVFDTTGAQPGLDLATAIVRQGGQINLFGWLKGTEATFDPTAWHTKGITIVNASPSAKIRDPFPPAIRLIEREIVRLAPLVSDVVSLQEYPALMQRATAGDPNYLKGVVRLTE